MSTIEQPVALHERTTLATERFFDAAKPELKELFTVIGWEDRWSDDLSTMVEVTQPWVKGDHFRPESPVVLDEESSVAAREVFGKMGLVEALPIPAGQYDQIIVLGGMQRANELRMSFLKDALYSGEVSLNKGGSIVLWGGERPFNDRSEGQFVQEAKTDINNQLSNAWFNTFQDNHADLSETELMRIAGLHHLGELSLRRAYVRLGSATVPISRYELAGDGYDVALLNTPAVRRPQGEPRHTTEACAEQWLKDKPPVRDARVAFVSSNPYIQRTTRVVRDVLNQNGRQDVQLIGTGPAAYTDPDKDYLFMGEIARNLYEDSKHAA